MITNLDPEASLFLANVNRIQQTLAQATAQVSSGLKIAVASDAPDEIGTLLQLRADEASNTQVQSNLSLAQTDAQTADSALVSAILLMDRATTLATQGATATSTAATNAALAQEVESLQAEMVSYSQTQVTGRYIFSGDLNGSPSYSLDLSAPTGVDQLSNAASTVQIQNPAGGSFPASKTAQEIFDDQNPDGSPATDNVFAALNALRLALTNNDGTAVTASITNLQAASEHLNSMEAFYGTVEDQIQDASSFSSSYDTELQTEIGKTQDADVTAAATILTEANTQLQAAYQSQGEMPKTSLFQFLG
jgi:flagellin-like hook-associated protein FlgL